MSRPVPIVIAAAERFDAEIFARNRLACVRADAVTSHHWRDLAAPLPEVGLLETRSGQPCFVSGRLYLNSRYDPVKEAQQAADEALRSRPDEPPEMAVVFGSAGLYTARALLERGAKTVFVYEPDPGILAATLGVMDVSTVAESGALRLVTDLEQLYFQVGFRRRMEPDLVVVACPAYLKAFPEAHKRFRQRVEHLVSDGLLLSQTMLVKMPGWFDSAMRNFPTFARNPSIDTLFHRFTRVPAVIVAAGPSLEKNIRLLGEFRDRVLIIAVGTALKKLDALGIVPDLVVAIESNDIAFQFDGVACLGRTWAALNLAGFPPLWDLPFRGVIGLSGKPASFTWLTQAVGKSQSEIPIGGSVANTAFSIAGYMDCDPVILVGQDLAFSESGVMHASGVGAQSGLDVAADLMEHLDDEARLERAGLYWIDGWHGGRVLTRSNFRHYLMWFEKNVNALSALGRRVYNCTEGGAYIHGFEHRPLADVLRELPPLNFDPAERIGEFAVPTPFDRVALLRRFQDALRDAQSLRRLLRMWLSQIAPIEKAIERAGDAAPKIADALRSAEITDRRIMPILTALDPLLAPVANTSLLTTQTVFDYDGLSDTQRTLMNLKQTANLYSGLEKAAEKVEKALIDLAERFAVKA